MKIGINTYIKSSDRTQIIGVADVDFDEDHIITIFGKIIPFDHLSKLLDTNTKPNNEKEVFSFESGVFEMVVYKLDN